MGYYPTKRKYMKTVNNPKRQFGEWKPNTRNQRRLYRKLGKYGNKARNKNYTNKNRKKVHQKNFHKYYNSNWAYGNRFIENGQTYRYFYRKSARQKKYEAKVKKRIKQGKNIGWGW